MAVAELFAKGDMAGARAKLHHDMQHYINEVTGERLQEILVHITENPQLGRGGLFIDEAVELAKLLEADGVDTFHVGQANHTGNLNDTIPAMGTRPECFMAPYARRVKEAVSVPVSTVGRIMTPEDGYEYKRVITPAGTPRKIAVVGGGPAGMEAARVAACGRRAGTADPGDQHPMRLRGHRLRHSTGGLRHRRA